jgi:hypothetical protein
MVEKLKCFKTLSNLNAFEEGQQYYIISEDSDNYVVINAQGKTHRLSKNEKSASYYGQWLSLEEK